MANYITECDFSIDSSQLLLKFIIEPFGRCFRPGNYQVHEMNDGALFIFWNQGLLSSEEMDILRKVVYDGGSLEDTRRKYEYKTLCRDLCPIMKRPITEEEKNKLYQVMEIDIPIESKEFGCQVKDCGMVTLVIIKNGVEHIMEGHRLLPKKWGPFVDLANTITGNCGTREDQRNKLFI